MDWLNHRASGSLTCHDSLGSHLGTAGPVGVDGAGAVTVRPGVAGLTQTLASPGVTPGMERGR